MNRPIGNPPRGQRRKNALLRLPRLKPELHSRASKPRQPLCPEENRTAETQLSPVATDQHSKAKSKFVPRATAATRPCRSAPAAVERPFPIAPAASKSNRTAPASIPTQHCQVENHVAVVNPGATQAPLCRGDAKTNQTADSAATRLFLVLTSQVVFLRISRTLFGVLFYGKRP